MFLAENFFSSYKFSADKTMKHFITFKFLFDLYLIKPQTSELPLPRNYCNVGHCCSKGFDMKQCGNRTDRCGFFCYYPTKV